MEINKTGFTETFEQATSPWFEYRNRGASTIVSGKGATLTLPAGAEPSPDQAPQLQTPFLCSYGTYEARLRVAGPGAQPQLGVVTGLFTYFNDGTTDTGATGITDNSEIDFEWLAARPGEILLSAWTKYRAADGEQRRVTRSIDLASGQVLWTRSFHNFGYPNAVEVTGPGNQPESVESLPDYNPSEVFHTCGLCWEPDRIVWWIESPSDGHRIVLWDLKGPDVAIPANPARFMANLWHTPSWAPDGFPGAVEPPQAPVTFGLEWIRYTPAPGPNG